MARASKADVLPEGVMTIAQAEARARAAQATAVVAPRTSEALPLTTVHLTALAPLCEGLEMSDPGRWRDILWRTPGQTLRAVLGRLQRRADQVALRVFDALPGVEVHDGANDPAPGCARLLAIIFDAPAAALVAAHLAMIQPEVPA